LNNDIAIMFSLFGLFIVIAIGVIWVLMTVTGW
jgi:hypothetical protein